MINTYATVITQYVQAGETSYAYPRMGQGVGRAFDLHADLSPGDGQHRSLVAGRVWPGPSGSSSSTTLVSRKSDLHETSK